MSTLIIRWLWTHQITRSELQNHFHRCSRCLFNVCFALCYSTLTPDNEFRDLAKVFGCMTEKTCQKLCSSLSFIPWSDKTAQVSALTCSRQKRFFRCITAILQSLVPAHRWAIEWNPSAIWWNPPRDDTLCTYSVSLSEQEKKKNSPQWH